MKKQRFAEAFNYSYDDRSFSDKDMWSTIYNPVRDMMIYDGSFKDSIWINDSHNGFYQFPLLDDTYVIEHHVKKDNVYRTIIIYNIRDHEIKMDEILYDGIALKEDDNEVIH